MDNPETASAAELEEDVAQSRARIEETVEEIQRRLSPGQLLDEVLLLSRSETPLAQHGRAFGAELVKTITANPIPVALVAVGLAWLVIGHKRNPH